jgi:hypothetical protein
MMVFLRIFVTGPAAKGTENTQKFKIKNAKESQGQKIIKRFLVFL